GLADFAGHLEQVTDLNFAGESDRIDFALNDLADQLLHRGGILRELPLIEAQFVQQRALAYKILSHLFGALAVMEHRHPLVPRSTPLSARITSVVVLGSGAAMLIGISWRLSTAIGFGPRHTVVVFLSACKSSSRRPRPSASLNRALTPTPVMNSTNLYDPVT